MNSVRFYATWLLVWTCILGLNVTLEILQPSPWHVVAIVLATTFWWRNWSKLE